MTESAAPKPKARKSTSDSQIVQLLRLGIVWLAIYAIYRHFHLPPGAVLLLGALALPLLRGPVRAVYMVALPVFSLVLLLKAPEGSTALSLFDLELIPTRIDRISLLFGYIFHVAALIGVIYSLHVKDTVQQMAGLMYAGSALGAVFAGDLLTLFVFWELLAVTSALLVWAPRTERSVRAGMRYLVVQVLSGVILLAGILIRYADTGSLAFGNMTENMGAGEWLILLAFGIKCGFPLLHNWLIDAYPESSPAGTVFLCAFTTKTAIYALARGFPGVEMYGVQILFYVGLVMTAFPIFYAVIENDLRRVLSYSMINQLGFMVCGIGLGTELAINGAVAHAFADILFKGLLFMAMGAVVLRVGHCRASDLGGLYKSMPKTTALCLVGALSISAFPFFSAFVTKSMIMTAALEEGHHWAWLVMLFASAGVLEHAGVKIPYFGFFGRDSGLRTREAPTNMLVAMSIAAVLSVAIGCLPGAFYSLLPYKTGYPPYTFAHVIPQVQLLMFAGLAIVWLHRSGRYPREIRATNLDFDWTYRRALPVLVDGVRVRVAAVREKVVESLFGLAGIVSDLAYGLAAPHRVLARTWSIGTGVLWITLFLGLYLMIYFLS